MSFIQYLKINRKTTIFALKIAGLLFSIIFVVIYILTEDLTTSFWNTVGMIVFIIILGNGFAGFIIFIAALAGYSDAKSIFRLYKKIPLEIKDRFGLVVEMKPLNYRMYYAGFKIKGVKENSPISFDLDNEKKQVLLTISNIFENANELNIKHRLIQKKYAKDSVSLTILGLQKGIKFRKWKKIDIQEIDNIILELYNISENEGIKVLHRYWQVEKLATTANNSP